MDSYVPLRSNGDDIALINTAPNDNPSTDFVDAITQDKMNDYDRNTNTTLPIFDCCECLLKLIKQWLCCDCGNCSC